MILETTKETANSALVERIRSGSFGYLWLWKPTSVKIISIFGIISLSELQLKKIYDFHFWYWNLLIETFACIVDGEVWEKIKIEFRDI